MLGASSTAMAVGALAAAVVGVAAFLSLTVRVGPDEFAIRQVYLGPGQGVHQDVYGPGLWLVIPGYERLHAFPRDLQVLDLNDREVEYFAQKGVPEDVRAIPSVKIQTSEGYQVSVDMTVLYRVVDPYTVLTKVGAGRIYESTVVERRADKILRQTFGRLDAEDFYDEQRRMTEAEDARRLLAEDLAPWGIQVWGVLVRGYSYDERYQDAIEQRKVQDQKVFKNQAEAFAASREAEKNRVIAEGQARIAVEKQRGDAEVRKIAADADLYARQRLAEGDKLVALAEAEGTRLENAALEAAGAGNIVGLRMAEALRGADVIVVSTTGQDATNPLDLDGLVNGW
jgi:regulator of protease activity HflC (stomatin/prohibitin superfamily)